jgi:pimeloyl-ACP methyl ester carboxylesterase
MDLSSMPPVFATASESVMEVAPGVALALRRWRPAGDPDGRFLLVHGLASNARLWDGVGRDLAARGHEAVAVDLRGHGQSDKPDQGYDFQTVTDDLLAVIDGLGWQRPVAVGQSWGGNLVVELAWRAPEQVAGVAAVDGGTIDLRWHYPVWSECARALRPPALAGMPAADLERRIRAAHPDWPEEGIAGTMANFQINADGTIQPWLTLDRHMAILRALWEHQPATRYPEIRVPVLLIPAEGESTGWSAERQEATRRAVAALPRGRSVAIEGDHDLHAQYPARIAEILHIAWVEGFWT